MGEDTTDSKILTTIERDSLLASLATNSDNTERTLALRNHDAAQRERIAALEAENAKLRKLEVAVRHRCSLAPSNHKEIGIAHNEIWAALDALDSRPSEVQSTDEPTCEMCKGTGRVPSQLGKMDCP